MIIHLYAAELVDKSLGSEQSILSLAMSEIHILYDNIHHNQCPGMVRQCFIRAPSYTWTQSCR